VRVRSAHERGPSPRVLNGRSRRERQIPELPIGEVAVQITVAHRAATDTIAVGEVVAFEIGAPVILQPIRIELRSTRGVDIELVSTRDVDIELESSKDADLSLESI
jgi:hypothetical protein